jgi:TolB-like protein
MSQGDAIYRRLALVALGLLVPAFGVVAEEARTRSIAVMYFRNNALMNREAMAPLEKGLAAMLTTELSKISALEVVERAQLQQLIREQSLGQTGAIDLSTAQEMGKLLGAETLLLGSFATDMRGKELRLDARIVETETGVTLKAEEMTDDMDDLFDMVTKLTRKIAKELDVELTRADKERLDLRGTESVDAAMHYARGLDYEDRDLLDEAIAEYRQALAISPDYAEARVRLVELGEIDESPGEGNS